MDEQQWLKHLNHFVTKEDLDSLPFCIILVVGLTEIFKVCLGGFNPRILVLIFSAVVSLSKTYLNNGITKRNAKKKILLALLNIVPIALGAVGVYGIVLRSIFEQIKLE